MNIFKEFDSILSSSVIPSTNIKIETKEELEKLFNGDYSEAFNNIKKEIYIFRGHKTPNDFATLKTTGLRVSQNTSNVYTTLMSEILPSWKNYPKRNACFVCSNNIYDAKSYGPSLSFVLPKNGEKIGVCPARDIWYSFRPTLEKYKFTQANQFNDLFTNLLICIMKIRSYINTSKNKKLEGNLQEIIINKFSFDIYNIESYLKELSLNVYTNIEKLDLMLKNGDSYLRQLFYHLSDIKLFMEMMEYVKKYKELGIIKLADDMLNSVKNKFELCNTAKELEPYTSAREIWFGGTALFVNQEKFLEMYELPFFDQLKGFV